MSRYRSIHCLIWNDDKFPFMSDDAKLVTFHLLTTPYSTPFGLFKVSLGALADEMRWPWKRYEKAFREVIEKGIAKYNERHHVTLIPKFLRYNQPANPNIIINWSKIYDEIPGCDLKAEFYHIFKDLLEGFNKGFKKGFQEAFIKHFSKGMPNQEQEQEQEQEQDEEAPPPTPPECPHRKIIELYHELLPELSPIKVWSEQRTEHLRTRWREDPERQDMEWWRWFFGIVKNSPFLMGKIPGREGRAPFKANLAWLIWPENFAKVLEGFYLQKGDVVPELPKHTRVNLEALERFKEREEQRHGGDDEAREPAPKDSGTLDGG